MRQGAGTGPVIHRIANRSEARSVEARHRAVVQWGLGLLLVLSLTTITEQPASVAASVLSGCREILAQCLIVLRATGAPLHWGSSRLARRRLAVRGGRSCPSEPSSDTAPPAPYLA